MKYYDTTWDKVVWVGICSGIIWGVTAITINAVTGVFIFEQSLISLIATFAIAGSLFGVATGGFMLFVRDLLPFSSSVAKSVLISTSLWFLLRIGSFFLSMDSPSRYHPDTAQTFQGLALSLLLGVIFGLLWKQQHKRG